ncbi:MAG: hypothetical protein H8E61_00800, partial [Bacteroidetes bacterium]|nr:hypothetical protein [Bacteroidota bacterium]
MSCKKSYFYRDDFNGRFMTMRYNSGLSLPVVGFHRRKNGQFYIPTPSETAFQAVAPVILTRRDCSIISTWKSAPLENLEMFGFSSDVLMLNPDDYSSD